MPATALGAFIGWIGSTAASAFGVTIALSSTAFWAGIATITLSVAAARRATNLKDPSEISRPSSGQTVMVRSTEAPGNIAYGEVQIGGVLTYVNSSGAQLLELYFEIVHTVHEIDSFIGWYLDNKFVPIADVDTAGDGSVDTNTGGHGLDPHDGVPCLYLRGHLGTSTQAVDSMLDSEFSDIGSTHRHRGCAKSVIRCDQVFKDAAEPGVFADKWPTGAPQAISAVVRGKKVYDPRADSTFPGGSGSQRLNDPTTWAWSDNPALIWADYRILDAPLGPGWDSDRINYQSVFDAADDCDALVAIPTATTEKRFRCDLVVDTSMEPREVVAKILATMAGHERHFNGQWHVYAGVAQTPDFTLDESDLVGEIQFRKQPQIEDRYNQVKGAFVDRERLWKRVQFVPVNNTSLRTNRDNGRVLAKEIDLDGVSREYQAQRLALRALNQADDTGILVFPAGYSALNIRPGDIGTVSIDEFGWSGKTFRCVGVKWVDFVGAELTLKEDSSGNYADPAEGEYSTRTAAGDIAFGAVQPWYLQARPHGLGWTFDGTFSATDADTVAWTSGTFRTADGENVYSISSGNTGNMTARTYIFLDVNVSTTALQTTTTAEDAIGPSRVLIGIAEDSTGTAAHFQVYGGGGGVLSTTNELAPAAATEVSQASSSGDSTVSTTSDTSVYQGSLTVTIDVVPEDVIEVSVTSRIEVTLSGSATGSGGLRVFYRVPPAGGFNYAGELVPVDAGTPMVGTAVGSVTGLNGTYEFGIANYVEKTGGTGTAATKTSGRTVVVTRVKR